MRNLFAVTFAAGLAVVVWSTFPTHAKPPYHATSIDPMGMMSKTNLLPEVEYDQGTVFVSRGVRY